MTPSKAKSAYWDGDVNWFSSKDIKTDELFDSGLKITSEGVEATGLQVYPPGCLFLVARSGILKRTFPVSINRVEATVNQDLKVLTPFISGLERYLQIMFRGMTDFVLRSLVKTGMTVQSLKYEEFELQPFPLPPLAEQKRIVAKVDELMALCDRLEAQHQERETRHNALARASLSRFAEAPTPANLNFLFHSSYTIPPVDLRKSILTLAVQGKLVPQKDDDEPADSILTATACFFEHLVAAKKLSAPKPLSAIVEEELPFPLPIGWAWCRLGQLMRISSGDALTSKDMKNGQIPVYGGNGVTGYHDSHNVARRTLVIGRVGFYCGSIHLTPEKAWVTDNAFITTFSEEHISIQFLSWLLKATDLRERDNATAQPVISGGKLYPTILGIPPLAEQRRIVAKVDQLMSLVDQLEMQLDTSRAQAEKLLEALVAELTVSTPTALS